MHAFHYKIGGSEFKVIRLNDAPFLTATSSMDNPQNVYDYLLPQLEQSLIYRPDVENLIVVHLTTRNKPIGFEIIANGILDTLLVHPREVFRSAILANSAKIVLSHSHPSGDPTPSEADIKVTRDLIRAGQLLKIEVCDHVILGKPSPENPKGFCSLRELGYFYAN
jgi:DNA repair protein RadC